MPISTRKRNHRRTLLKGAGALGLTVAALPAPARAQTDSARMSAAERSVKVEFQPSSLTVDKQMAEMEFFIRAAEPFRGQQIYVVSETIDTHEYESRVLARAFRKITDVSVIHELVRENQLVERLQQQNRSGRNLYDAYVNDSDNIGTHYRTGTPCRSATGLSATAPSSHCRL